MPPVIKSKPSRRVPASVALRQARSMLAKTGAAVRAGVGPGASTGTKSSPKAGGRTGAAAKAGTKSSPKAGGRTGAAVKAGRPNGQAKIRGHLAMDPRIRQRRVAVARSAGRKRLRATIASLLVVTVIALVWVVLNSPIFELHHFRVSGNQHETAAQIQGAAGLAGSPALLSISPTSAAKGIERLPWVKGAQVAKAWPWTVKVAIQERVPVAEVAGSNSIWLLTDSTGRVLSESKNAIGGLPEILAAFGFRGESPNAGPTNPRPGTWLTGQVLGDLAVAGGIPQDLVGSIPTIVSNSSGSITLGWGSEVNIAFGPPTDISSKFESLVTLIANKQVQGGDRVDLTVPALPTISNPPPPSQAKASSPTGSVSPGSGSSSSGSQLASTAASATSSG